MNIKISIPLPNDAEAVYDLFKDTWLATYPNVENDITTENILSKYPEDKREKTIARWEKFYTDLNTHFESSETRVWVSKENNKIVGVVTLDNTNPLKIGALYVHPSAQGKGIGSLLMNHIFDYVSNAPLQLNVAKYNARAIKFYKHFGFKIAGDVIDSNGQLPSGKIIPEIKMLRKIEIVSS